MGAEADLADAYEAAGDEWESAGEADVGDEVDADGLDPSDEAGPP